MIWIIDFYQVKAFTFSCHFNRRVRNETQKHICCRPRKRIGCRRSGSERERWRLATGSYQTGITGLTAYAGKDPAEVVTIIKGADHGMDGMMGEQDYTDIANFVAMSQVDFATYINYDDKTVKGDVAKGEAVYETVCAMCHGPDGKQPKDMEDKGVGALSRANPQEIFHKIMNGQPHEVMPPMRAFGPQTAVDILAYAQTLPE